MDLLHYKKRISVLITFILVFAMTGSAFPVSASEETVVSENSTVSVNITESEDTAVSTDDMETAEHGEDDEVLLSLSEDIIPEEAEATVDSTSVDGISRNSLSSNFTKPFTFLTKRKVILNGMRRTVSADTYLVLNTDGDYELNGIVSSDSLGVITEKVSYNALPAFRISLVTKSSTPKGTYRFDITVRNKTGGAESKKVRLVVVVKKSNPFFKWQKQVVMLNKNLKGDFALNSPTIEGVSIVPPGSTKYKAKIPKGIGITLQNENTVKITADQSLNPKKKYPVLLWLVYSDSNTVKTVKKVFYVKLSDLSPAVTMKRVNDSSLNLSDRNGTALHYRPVAKNSGMEVKDISFSNEAVSKNYILEEKRDPETGAITDIYVRASENAVLGKGRTTMGFNVNLTYPRMDAKTVKAGASFSAPIRSTKIRLAYISGNTIKLNETLSDNHIAGTLDVRVAAPKYSKIDAGSILDLTFDSGKVPKGAFRSYWTVDEYGQAARLKVVADRSKLVSGKKYNLVYSLKAKGTAKATPATKLVIKVKAS